MTCSPQKKLPRSKLESRPPDPGRLEKRKASPLGTERPLENKTADQSRLNAQYHEAAPIAKAMLALTTAMLEAGVAPTQLNLIDAALSAGHSEPEAILIVEAFTRGGRP